MRFRDRIAMFMTGRNGTDTLQTVFLWSVPVFLLIGWIFRIAGLFVPYLIFYILSFVAMWYAWFRLLSRNVVKRREENRRFLAICRRVKNFFKLQKNKFRDRKTHVYYRCPHCRVTLRLPRQKGKHTVVCPKCGGKSDLRI